MPIASQLTHSEMGYAAQHLQMLTPGIVKDLPENDACR